MLSLFPQLLDWSWYTPLLFRGFIAAYLISLIITLLRKHDTGSKRFANKGFATIFILLALTLLFGIYVQIMGVIGFSFAMTALFFRKRYSKDLKETVWFYVLIGLVSLSLVFLGAGPYAFDIPL